MEEKKLNALNDEALDKVAGGEDWLQDWLHPDRLLWCPKCQENEWFYADKSQGSGIEYRCRVCGGTEFWPAH